MTITHLAQAENTPSPIPATIEIDRSPELARLAQAGALSAYVAAAIVGWGRCRTLGRAAQMGRRWMLSLPGLGVVGVAEVEALAAYDIAVQP